jgi:hypothetical protein
MGISRGMRKFTLGPPFRKKKENNSQANSLIWLPLVIESTRSRVYSDSGIGILRSAARGDSRKTPEQQQQQTNKQTTTTTKISPPKNNSQSQKERCQRKKERQKKKAGIILFQRNLLFVAVQNTHIWKVEGCRI